MPSPAPRARNPGPALPARDPAPGSEDAGPAVDLVHLARQTLGDRELEAELLGLFTRQARALAAALDAAAARQGGLSADAADPLHMLCGSARAVGCWAVGEAAQSLERDLRDPGVAPPGPARLAPLRVAVARACAAIADVLEP